MTRLVRPRSCRSLRLLAAIDVSPRAFRDLAYSISDKHRLRVTQSCLDTDDTLAGLGKANGIAT